MATDITVVRKDIRYTTTLETLSCGACGVPFAMPKDMHDKVQKTGDWFWCPNGDKIHYSETENQRLERQLDDHKRWLKSAESRLTHEQDQRLAAQRSASAYKGQVTKIRKRVGNGVCPCCNRTFKQLAAHMERMHPEYADAAL